MRIQHIALTWLALLALQACASHGDDIAARREAIVNGTSAVSDGAVVMIGVRRPANGPLKELCTGTLISPHVVLTAAHCLHPDIVGADAGFYVFQGDDIWTQQNDLSLWFQVASVTPEPRFDPNAASPKPHDIGFVVLTTPSDRTPMPVKLGGDPLKVGDPLRQIGYGYDGADGGGQYGVRHQLGAQIARIDPESFKYTTSPANPCGGDSGGPLLGGSPAGEQLVGTFASYTSLFGGCDGKTGYAIPTADHATFIRSAVNGSDPGFLDPRPDGGATDAGSGTAPPPATSAGCSAAGMADDGEGALALLATLTTAIGLRRRRYLMRNDPRRHPQTGR